MSLGRHASGLVDLASACPNASVVSIASRSLLEKLSCAGRCKSESCWAGRGEAGGSESPGIVSRSPSAQVVVSRESYVRVQKYFRRDAFSCVVKTYPRCVMRHVFTFSHVFTHGGFFYCREGMIIKNKVTICSSANTVPATIKTR